MEDAQPGYSYTAAYRVPNAVGGEALLPQEYGLRSSFCEVEFWCSHVVPYIG